MAEPTEATKDEQGPGLAMPTGGHWAYVASALVSVFGLGLGLALGDQRPVVTALWSAALLLSMVSLFRPTMPAWLYLFAASTYLMVVELGVIHSLSVSGWLSFAIGGLIPCMALWSVRPRRKAHIQWLR